jgi:hypothetical protein
MSDEILSEDDLTSALQGDRDAILKVLNRVNGLPTPAAEQAALEVAAGQARANWLHAEDKFKEERSDLYVDGLAGGGPECLAEKIDLALANKHPNMDPHERLAHVGRIIDKTVGDPAQRAIRAMKLQRQPWLKAEDLYPDISQPQPDEFDSEHDAGISEAIEEMRQSRGGRIVTAEERQRGLEAIALKKRRSASGG